jgi:outer membrane protein OmpA-like peptidoglycan-associated protein
LFLAAALAAPQDVDSPLRTNASSPDAAVVIGIEDYAFLPDVPFAEADAAAMANFFVYTRGIKSDRVTRLYGSTRANREKILSSVQRAADAVGPGGTVWVSYSGHGAASKSDGKRMIVGIDAVPDESFDARSVPLDEIEQAAGSAHVIFLVDACYSGVGRGGGELMPGRRFAIPTGVQVARGGSILWTATTGNELAGPYNEARHGAFTYWALGALRGWADGELSGQRDGKVSLEEANLYVSRKLREQQNFEQTPAITGATSLVLSEGTLEAEYVPPKAPEPVVTPPVAVVSLPVAAPAVVARGREIQIREVLMTSALFAADKAAMKPRSSATAASYATLDAVVSILRDYPDIAITVAGHTDSTGSDDYNLRISQQRAAAVAAWIVGQNIAASRVSSEGYGENRPIDDNRTEEGRTRNRRIEFQVR